MNKNRFLSRNPIVNIYSVVYDYVKLCVFIYTSEERISMLYAPLIHHICLGNCNKCLCVRNNLGHQEMTFVFAYHQCFAVLHLTRRNLEKISEPHIFESNKTVQMIKLNLEGGKNGIRFWVFAPNNHIITRHRELFFPI